MLGEVEEARSRLNAEWTADRSDGIAAAIRAAVPPSPHAMDYGCGPGHVGLRLLGHFDHLSLVDSDRDAVAALAARTAGLQNIRAFALDLTVEDPPEPVDCLIASMSLHHVRNIEAVLAGFARTIRPGGWLVVADLHADHGEFHRAEPEFDGHHGFDSGDLASRIAAHGFDPEPVTDAWAGQRWCGDLLVDYSVFLLVARSPR